MRWDLFCRVVDNYGDVGFGWRLAADLAARGEAVRLWLDDASALAWLAPQGAAGVTVLPWSVASAAGAADSPAPGEVVIEAFGCDPPPPFVQRMAAQAAPPVWINLEHLSAEAWVERAHGLPSPQQLGPGRGLTKWFFLPGFTPLTGGLLREPGLMAARERFDASGWLHSQGLLSGTAGADLPASVFCYDGALPEPPVALRLLLAPGAAQRRFAGRANVVMLPWLAQTAYDRLLWSCALNVVRGEDSLVRAIWAGAPFVWHIYPQHDGAHAAKLEALLDRLLDGAEPALAGALRALWRGWNGLGPAPSPQDWPALDPWRAACTAWRARLLAQPDLVTQLRAFVACRR